MVLNHCVLLSFIPGKISGFLGHSTERELKLAPLRSAVLGHVSVPFAIKKFMPVDINSVSVIVRTRVKFHLKVEHGVSPLASEGQIGRAGK